MKLSLALARILASSAVAGAFSAPASRAFVSRTTLLAAASLDTSVAKEHQDIHVPVGEDGLGEYTAATKGCFDVIDKATPLVLSCVDSTLTNQESENNQPFTIADFGTADAGTSLGLMDKIVQQVRTKSANKEILIQYEDQCTNEWKSVFRHALGQISPLDAYGNPITSPMVNDDKVFVQACGVGFHEQCFPSNSVDVAVSFTAMHWLSASANSLRGRTEMHAAQCTDIESLEEKTQAAKDWKSILEARARELKVGGHMVLVNFCVSKDGYFLGQTDVGASMWESFGKAWQKLYDDGVIDESERDGVSFPNYYRTTEEVLEGVASIPGLRVISSDEHVVRCPYREQWLAGKAQGVTTPKEYAEWFVPTTRTWSQSTFSSALRQDREDRDQVLSQFWQNYMDLVEQNPDAHGMDYVHNYLVLQKVA